MTANHQETEERHADGQYIISNIQSTSTYKYSSYTKRVIQSNMMSPLNVQFLYCSYHVNVQFFYIFHIM